jgi:DNA-directed RNA polymerase specialized sigma24 family protein
MPRSRGVVGRASRGVLREIDDRLRELDGELSTYQALVAERERLLAARASVTGERRTQRISQDELATYLAEHPGQRAGEIAEALGVPLATISSHLYRGKSTRFESRPDGWYVRDGHGGPKRPGTR